MSTKNKDEIIKMLLDKIWDIVSDGDEVYPDEYEKYEKLAKEYDSNFGIY